MATPTDIVREARALLGLPWRHMGRTAAGVDCFGHVLLTTRAAGIDLSRHGVVVPRRYGRVVAEAVYRQIAEICLPCSPRAGALVWFQLPGNQYPRHFGILTADDTVIHAEALVHRKVIEHGFRAQWLGWASGCWMIPGVRYE